MIVRQGVSLPLLFFFAFEMSEEFFVPIAVDFNTEILSVQVHFSPATIWFT